VRLVVDGGGGVGREVDEGGEVRAVVEVDEVEGPGGTEVLNCNLLAAFVKSPLSVIVAMANQLPE